MDAVAAGCILQGEDEVEGLEGVRRRLVEDDQHQRVPAQRALLELEDEVVRRRRVQTGSWLVENEELHNLLEMVVTTRDGDVEDLLSLEHDRLVIQPFRFRQDTLIALFDGVCPLQNVRVGKAWVRMPPDLGFTIAKQAPAAFHVHCEKVEAEMLELPDVLPKSRVLEIVTDLFGQQKRKKNRRRRRASSKRASKRRRNGRAQRRGSQDVIDSRLRCAFLTEPGYAASGEENPAVSLIEF